MQPEGPSIMQGGNVAVGDAFPATGMGGDLPDYEANLSQVLMESTFTRCVR
jgi:hypothetical protein